MTWNVENFERPLQGATDDVRARYEEKLQQVVTLIAGVGADLVGLQELLGPADDLAPPVFEDLRAALTQKSGQDWSGLLSPRPDSRGIRVGWLSPGQLSNPRDVALFSDKVPAVTVADDGTTITTSRRGALAVTYTRGDGLRVDAVTAHLKSKLLSFPGRQPDKPRFDTRDEGERARYGVYALAQRAAEAATVRAWATGRLQGHGQERRVLVCGDLNDTPEAATTELLLGPPGSQLGTGGFDHPDAGDGNRLWNLAPEMPAGDPETGQEAANWSRINNGQKELIDQILVSHALVTALDSTESLPVPGIKSVTADPASLAGMDAPSDHRPVVARFTL
jgi:endonuclease/exonuclease/phosphatase family metal-dependent hydrolase